MRHLERGKVIWKDIMNQEARKVDWEGMFQMFGPGMTAVLQETGGFPWQTSVVNRCIAS